MTTIDSIILLCNTSDAPTDPRPLVAFPKRGHERTRVVVRRNPHSFLTSQLDTPHGQCVCRAPLPGMQTEESQV